MFPVGKVGINSIVMLWMHDECYSAYIVYMHPFVRSVAVLSCSYIRSMVQI